MVMEASISHKNYCQIDVDLKVEIVVKLTSFWPPNRRHVNCTIDVVLVFAAISNNLTYHSFTVYDKNPPYAPVINFLTEWDKFRNCDASNPKYQITTWSCWVLLFHTKSMFLSFTVYDKNRVARYIDSITLSNQVY